eukprot:gene3905-6385_t
MTNQRVKLGSLLADTRSSIGADALMDSLVALNCECKAAHLKRLKTVESFSQRHSSAIQHIKDLRPKREDFEVLKVIGRGAYGEVHLVRHKESHELFALKTLSKCEMLKKADTAFYWEERDIMSHSNSPWIVRLHFAFQDEQYLYMAMEYLAGGDLINLQDKVDFPEEWARFYTAELILALEDLHSMGYVHRDIKPDNILLDAKGHLKLVDFGTCVKLDANGMVSSPQAAVGTPDYISPEILDSQNGDGKYGTECDWWSVGVFLYELLFSEPPFYDDTLLGTYGKIMNHNPEQMKFPSDVSVSDDAKDLLKNLLCPREKRLGKGDITELKAHPFFHGIDWSNLRKTDPPHIPTINGSADTSNFPEVEAVTQKPELFAEERSFSGNQLPFIGFTFHREPLAFSPVEENHNSKIVTEHCDIAEASTKAMNERLRESLSKYKQEIQILKEQCHEEVVAKEQALREIGTLNHQLTKKTDAANSETSKQLAMSQLEIDGLKAKLEKLEATKLQNEQNTRTALQSLEFQYSDAKEEINKLNNQLQTARDELAKMIQEQKSMITPRLRESVDLDVSSTLEQQLKAANRTKESLKRQIDDLESQLLLSERSARRERSKCAELEESIDSMKSQLAAAQSSAVDSSNRISELEHDQSALKDTLAQKEIVIRELRKKCSELEVDIEELQSVRDRNEEFRKQMAVTDTTNRSENEGKVQAEQIKALESRLKAAIASESSLLNELESLEDDAVRLRGENKRLSTIVSQLQEQLNSEEREGARHLKDEVITLKHHNKELTNELNDLREMYSRHDDTSKILRQQYVTLQEEHAALEIEVTQLQQSQNSITEYEETVASLQERLEARQSNNNDLLEQISALTAKRSTLESRIDTMQQEDKAKSEQLSTLTSHIEVMEAQQRRHELEHQHETTELKDKLERSESKFSELSQILETTSVSHKKQRDLLKTRISSLEEENDDLHHQIHETKAIADAQQTKLTQLTNKVKELECDKDILKQQQKQAVKGLEVLRGTTHTQCELDMQACALAFITFSLLLCQEPSSRVSEKMLQKELKKLRKDARNSEAEVRRLTDALKAMEADSRRRLLSTMEDHGKFIRALQQQFEKELTEKNERIDVLTTKCTMQEQSIRTLEATLRTVEGDESLRKYASPRLRRHISSARIRHAGWLCIPGKQGLKKSGWNKLYCILDIDGMKLYTSDKPDVHIGPPTFVLQLSTLRSAEPVKISELIHSSQKEISAIFKVTALTTEDIASRSSNKSKPNLTAQDVPVAKGVALPRPASIAVSSRRGIAISTSEESDIEIPPVWKIHNSEKDTISSVTEQNDTVLCEHLFKAESSSEQRTWVSRLSVLLEKKEDILKYQQSRKDKCNSLSLPEEARRTVSSPTLARKRSGASNESTSSRVSYLSICNNSGWEAVLRVNPDVRFMADFF